MAIAFAVFALINPKLGLLTLTIVLGLELLIVHLIKLFADARTPQTKLQGTNIGIDSIAIGLALIILVVPTIFVRLLIIPIILGLILFGAGRIANGGFDPEISKWNRRLNILVGALMFLMVILIILIPQIALYFLAYLLAAAFLLLGAESLISGVTGKQKKRKEPALEEPEETELSVKGIRSIQKRSIIFRAIEESFGRLRTVRGKPSPPAESTAKAETEKHPVQPVDGLVSEHKLILQAIEGINGNIAKMQVTQKVNPGFITDATDFFRTYTDLFHHGKEEGILFKKLQQKMLNEADQKMLNELITDHEYMRQTVAALDAAREKILSGDRTALKEALESLAAITKFYPLHIRKEEEHFFNMAMQYLSEQERRDMLANFSEFNRNFTDRKYTKIIDSFK